MAATDMEDLAIAEDVSPIQEHSSDPNNHQVTQISTAKKGKSSRPGKRTVTNLTSSQLARKRANDRDAQRNARQRTKNYIESLEKQIQELLKSSGANDGSKLAELQLRNQELEDSMAKLKAKMTISSPPLVQRMELSTRQCRAYYDEVSRGSCAASSTYVAEVEPASHADDYALAITASAYNGLEDDTVSGLKSIALSDSMTANTKLPPSPPNITTIPTSFVNQPTTKFWEIPVLLLPPENAVSGTLISMVHDIRREHAQSPSEDQFLRDPSFRSFFCDSSESCDFLSMALANLMISAGMTRVPEMIAAIWGAYKLIQWQIRPCRETYEKLPSHLSPRPSQLVTHHPHWVTMLQFPKLRDKVIERQDLYATSKFLSLYPQSLRIHWPFDDIDTINPENGQATDIFMKHFLNIGNWSLTEPFTQVYPELISVCRYTSS